MSSLLVDDGLTIETHALRLSRLLGTGRHGAVFLARLGSADDHLRPVDVAVKIPTRLGTNAESEALRRFSHLHVVELIGTRADDGAMCLELLTGGTLSQHLEVDGLDPSGVKSVGGAVASVLQLMHDQNWVHGDISPGNIGFRGDGTPVLFDFALARPIGDNEMAEHNPAFTGPHHRASKLRDVRSLAETMRLATADPALARQLRVFVIRCDQSIGSEAPPTLADLRTVWSRFEARLVATPSASTPTGCPASEGGTVAFGVTPPTGPALMRKGRGWHRRFVIVGAVAIAVTVWAAALGLSSRGEATSDPEPSGAVPKPTVVRTLAATSSLEQHGATWSPTQGILSVTSNGAVRRLLVGALDDQAAIADWNCDGLATLGLYRATTDEFFWFDSWAIDSVSSPPETVTSAVSGLVPSSRSLTVALDAHDCARPAIR